jgi:hypothetical protein
MSNASQPLSPVRRSWLLAGALMLSACMLTGGLDSQIESYETSVRAEADWLWNNMNYARTHLQPDDTYCKSEVFVHRKVTLDDATRQSDPQRAALVDRVDYAAVLVRQAHDEWNRFCSHQNSAVGTVAALEPRLTLAYANMNQVRGALQPCDPTPAPGST